MTHKIIKKKLEDKLQPRYEIPHSKGKRYTLNEKNYKTVLIHNAPFIFTCDKNDHILTLENHSILIENDTIVDVVHADKVKNKNFDLVYDAGKGGGVVITPGLFNTHTHPPMYLMRSAMMLDEGEGLDETIAAMPKWERSMSKDDYTIATIGDLTEQQKHGVTSTLSHYGVFHPIETASAITKQNTINCMSAASNTHPENTPDLIRELAHQSENFHSQVGIALHYLYKADRKTLEEISAISKEYDMTFTCHMAESPMVVEECLKRHGKSEVHTLADVGLLNERSVTSHNIYVTDEEIKMMADSGMGISHLPTSNVIHKSGTFPYWKFFDAGAFSRMSLGTDGVVSKSRLDILTEAYQTRITHLYDKTILFSSLFKMMTVNGARGMRMPFRGTIQKGMKADMCFWKLKDRGFIPYDENNPMTLIGNIITHGGRVVRDLMINGKFIIAERKHLMVDESKLLTEIQSAHMDMRRRVEGCGCC